MNLMRSLITAAVMAMFAAEAWASEAASIIDRWLQDPLFTLSVFALTLGFVMGIYRGRPVYAFAAIALALVLNLGPGLYEKVISNPF